MSCVQRCDTFCQLFAPCSPPFKGWVGFAEGWPQRGATDDKQVEKKAVARPRSGLNFLSIICTLTPFWGARRVAGLNRNMGYTLTGNMGYTLTGNMGYTPTHYFEG